MHRFVCYGIIKSLFSNFMGGKTCTTKQINRRLCFIAHFLTGSSLLLITALNSCVNKTCWQHVTACDIKEEYIKTWFMCGSQGSSIVLLQVHSSLPALSVGCLRGLVSTGRSLTPVDVGVRVWAREEEPTHTNETLLCFWSSSDSKEENVYMCVWMTE